MSPLPRCGSCPIDAWSTVPTDERRYYGLDALRGAMMMLGIVLHAATLYLAAPPPHVPLTTDRNTSLTMDAIFDLIHSFRMPCFFVLAGFFASLLVEKRGVPGTYRNRAARILGPLLAGMVTVLPIAGLFMLDFTLSVLNGTHDILPSRQALDDFKEAARAQGVPVGQVFLGHLWFLYYLLYFYLLIPLCEWLKTRMRLPAGSVIGFVLVTMVPLWAFPGAQVLGNFLFITPMPEALGYYGLFFVVGYLFHGQRGFVQGLSQHVKPAAICAAILFPASLFASHLEYTQGAAWHALAVPLHAACTWALIYLAIGAALRFVDRPDPWIVYTSNASYWVFLLHLPVVCMAAFFLVPYDLPAEVKFLAVAAITTLVCFTTYHYGVQHTWVSAFLNGKRFNQDWPWKKPVVAEVVTP
jgi:glucan biosynthesis protein C